MKGWTWDFLTGHWDDAYKCLNAYTEKTGAARPPRGFKTATGFALGSWVCRQRTNREALLKKRIKLLESLKGWSWDIRSWDIQMDKWSDAYKCLKEYTAKTGVARPLQAFKAANGFALGSWTSLQRSKRDSLPPERIKQLQSLKGWTWDFLTDQWDDAYKCLKAHTEKTGAARPPSGFKTPNGFPLGSWVNTQRQKRDSLSSDRIKLLESLKGWSWNARMDNWSDAYECLKAYTLKSGAARPPRGHKTPDGFQLGSWTSLQRSKRDSLSPERIKQLQILKGWTWDPYGDQWDEAFKALKEYTARMGVARPGRGFVTLDGVDLASWVGAQRINKDSLSKDRIKLLKSLDGWSWDPYSDQWTDAYKCLKQYVSENGHARPPTGHKSNDGFALGSWARNQRSRKDTLSSERKRLLQSLDGWSWGAKGASKSKKK